MRPTEAPAPIEEIELHPLLDHEPEAPPPASLLSRIRASFGPRLPYFASVILPTAILAAYFFLIASDLYETETRFIVRSPSAAATSQLANLVQGSGIVRSSDDAYVIHAYMQSRDVVATLLGQVPLEAELTGGPLDIFWHYPGLLGGRTKEHLWRHFQRFLTLDFDRSTGITTLRVKAFSPESAHQLAEKLLVSSEQLLNRLSQRAQREAVEAAEREVERSRVRAEAAVAAMTDFRRRHAVIDPGRSSDAALQIITELALAIAKTRADLLELERVAPSGPQATSLKIRIAALESQIQKEREALAGADKSLAPLMAEYESLLLERGFTERAYAASQSALDFARVDVGRQALFLERISSPSLPDYAKYPYRFLNSVLALLAFHTIFMFMTRILRDTRSHGSR